MRVVFGEFELNLAGCELTRGGRAVMLERRPRRCFACWRVSWCGNSSKPAMMRGYLLARMGRREEARAVLAALDDTGQQRFVPAYASAMVHLA